MDIDHNPEHMWKAVTDVYRALVLLALEVFQERFTRKPRAVTLLFYTTYLQFRCQRAFQNLNVVENIPHLNQRILSLCPHGR